MSEVIDWQTVPDPEGAVRAAATAIVAGRVVLLPTESGYVLAASARSAEAKDELLRLLGDTGDPPAFGVSCEAVARDWEPRLGAIGRRLARRLWPGPVTLVLTDPAEARLPAAAADIGGSTGTIRLRNPAHEVVREVLRLVPEPVMLGQARYPVGPDPATGLRVAEAIGASVPLVIDAGPVRFPAGPTVVSLSGNEWQVLREGAVPVSVIERQSACLIVFVCTGNTCRSPLAESLCKKRLSEQLGCTPDELPRRGYVVTSAGLAAYPGCPAAPEAIAVAAAHGADLTGHHAQAITAEMLFHADYVVGMTRDHVEALDDVAAGLAAPARLLRPDGEDLPDPVGRERAVYEECAAAIWKQLDALIAEILAPAPPERPNN
jgi:protein-tyrosine phosphatase